jgi:2-haloacid dehalogenase
MAKGAGLAWDCILCAEVFRKYKPDPDTYLGVAKIFDLEPAQVMLVASHNNDLEAARACGLKTAYIERPLEFGAQAIKDVSPDSDNDIHAETIIHLAELLEC